jgi:hypothetical protein
VAWFELGNWGCGVYGWLLRAGGFGGLELAVKSLELSNRD